MADVSNLGTAPGAPEISKEEMHAFHNAHFSPVSTDHFALHFLGPVDEEYYEKADEEDDGLGYYDDGVKRTLTDEQIAMFRHSEIQRLLQAQRHSEVVPDQETKSDANSANTEVKRPLPSISPPSSPDYRPQRKGKKGKQKQKGYYKKHIKPDLRKRTWDKVEQGLGSLDYGEEQNAGPAAASSAPKRRQITYEEISYDD